jgi:hypothetical protein
MVVSKFFLLKSESQARFERRWANLNPDRFGSARAIIHDPQHPPIQGAMVMLKSRSSDWAKSASTDAKRRGFLQCRAPRRLFNQRGEPRLCSVSAEPGRQFGDGTRNAFSAECGGCERDTAGLEPEAFCVRGKGASPFVGRTELSGMGASWSFSADCYKC